jgi:glycosyltransferase involved in cell wall biosynthesis
MDLSSFFMLHWQQGLFISLILAGSVQMFYYLFFFSRLAFHQSKPNLNHQKNPVTAIVCARDEAANLASNVPAVMEQQYPYDHEIIIVNDNSFDETKYILEEFQKTYPKLQVIELTQEAKMIPGKKFPLSIGIKSAKHDIVLLTDADCIPASAHWMESMQLAYGKDTEIVLGYGAFQKGKGLLNKLIRWEAFHTALQYLSYALAGMPYMGVGRNLSYKKLIFFRHKGFSAHNHLPGGDDDLFINAAANKTNTEINIDKNSFTISKPARSWSQWIKQKRRHYSTSKYYKPLHKFLLALYAGSHFLFYPLVVAAALFYSWKLSLIVFSVKFFVQMVLYIKVLVKLDEKDLIPFVLFFDLWMFFYYIIFATALIRKPRQTWK